MTYLSSDCVRNGDNEILHRSSFQIQDHIDKLTPAKEKGRYHCPACDGHNLTISKAGAYQCWNGCAVKDIRDAIAPLPERSSTPRYQNPRIKNRKPKASAPLPDGDIQLARLPNSVEIPQRHRRHNPERGQISEIEYPYSETQWVQRVDWADSTKPKGRDKTILPFHTTSQGEIKCGKGDDVWLPYRFNEVQQYGAGKWITVAEGEDCTETCRGLRLVGTTLQGASWNDVGIDAAMVQLMQCDVAGLVYLPDNDNAGATKSEKIAAAAAKIGMPCLIIEPLALWQDMPHSGDIADWIEWGKAQGMEANDFIQKLEQEIHAALAARLEEQRLEDPDQRLKLELQALLKESDPIKRMRLRSEIASNYRLKSSDIQEALKHLEQQAITPQQTYFTFDDFFNQGSEAVDWVIPQLLPRGETVLLAAQAKCGKTNLATDVMYAVLSGGKVIGEQVGVKGKVLLISSDESPSSTRRRMRLRGFDLLAERSNLRIMTHLDITNLTELESRLEDFRPDLVVIDSLTTICSEVGISEKDPEFARYIYKLKAVLGRYNAACILTHHENKDALAKGINQVSGSARIPAAVWGILQLKAIDPNNDQDPHRLLKLKPREGEAIALNLKLNPKDQWLTDGIWQSLGEVGDESGQKRTQGDRVLGLLGQYSPRGLTYKEIDNALNMGKSLYQVLDRLEDRQLITKRRSEFNSRQWVYAVPRNEQDTPPPTVDHTEVVENDESHTEKDFQQFDNQFNNDSTPIQQPTMPDEVLNSSNIDLASDSAPIQQLDSQGGGEGVSNSTNQLLNSTNNAIPAQTQTSPIPELIEGLSDEDKIRHLRCCLSTKPKLWHVGGKDIPQLLKFIRLEERFGEDVIVVAPQGWWGLIGLTPSEIEIIQ